MLFVCEVKSPSEVRLFKNDSVMTCPLTEWHIPVASDFVVQVRHIRAQLEGNESSDKFPELLADAPRLKAEVIMVLNAIDVLFIAKPFVHFPAYWKPWIKARFHHRPTRYHSQSLHSFYGTVRGSIQIL